MKRDHKIMTPEEILQKLMDGNKRFVDGQALYPHHDPTRRNEISEAQYPFAVVLCCSDSRVPPEIIFDQGLGDLFTVRVGGNIVNNEILGSIEYAVHYLGVRFVLVLGHENCGAVNAAVLWDSADGHMDFKLKAIKPAVELAKEMEGNIVENSSKCNVELVIDKIKSAEPILSKLSKSKELTIMGGYYNLKSGVVDIINTPEHLKM